MSGFREKTLTRRRLQIRLSTSILVMILAGGMLLPNVIRRGPYYNDFDEPGHKYEIYDVGWPFAFKSVTALHKEQPEPKLVQNTRKNSREIEGEGFTNVAYGPTPMSYLEVMLLNSILGLIILVLVGAFCEHAFKIKVPPPPPTPAAPKDRNIGDRAP